MKINIKKYIKHRVSLIIIDVVEIVLNYLKSDVTPVYPCAPPKQLNNALIICVTFEGNK